MNILDKIYNIRDRFLCKFPSDRYLYLPEELLECHILAMAALVNLSRKSLDTIILLDEATETLEYALRQTKNTNGYSNGLPLVYSYKYNEKAIKSSTNLRLKIVNEQKNLSQQIKLAELKGEEASPIILQRKEKLDCKIHCYDIAIDFLSELKKYTAQYYKEHKEKK